MSKSLRTIHDPRSARSHAHPCLPSPFPADIFDAKQACEHLAGFNVGGRYLNVLYYHPQRAGRTDVAKAQADVAALKSRVAANEAAEKAMAGAGGGPVGAGGGGAGAGSDADGDERLDEDERDRKLATRR